MVFDVLTVLFLMVLAVEVVDVILLLKGWR